MKIRIDHDVYNISKRIKEIDKNYYIVFDTSRSKFEIHNSSQIGSSYCLTLPFNELDERVINHVYQTQSANIDIILEKIENENKLRESANKSSALSQVYSSIEDIIRS